MTTLGRDNSEDRDDIIAPELGAIHAAVPEVSRKDLERELQEDLLLALDVACEILHHYGLHSEYVRELAAANERRGR